MAAWRAMIGSISVIITLAPKARKACAQPLPTSPYPATMATFPANMTSVALLIPSTSDSLQPYKLSNLLCKHTSRNAKRIDQHEQASTNLCLKISILVWFLYSLQQGKAACQFQNFGETNRRLQCSLYRCLKLNMHDDPTFVTESLTLIEGIFSLPAAIILAKL